MSEAPTTVRSVRVRGIDADPVIARLRLGSLLAGAELRPPGLPPSAVLCVRQIIDPLPGTLRLDTAGVRAPAEWERAFVAALERVLRSAARPAREAVPAGADAVLFADRAELLACLARDARDGTAWTQWWWRDLRASAAGGTDPVVAAWLAAPEHVPAALELLAARNEAVAFVATLAPNAAKALAERVATAFALPQLRPQVTSSASPARPRRAASVRAAPPPEPPWRRSVPETTRQPLAPAAELLLGVALALRRSPNAVRSPEFAATTRAWLAAADEARRAVAARARVAADAAAAPSTPMRPRRAHPSRPHIHAASTLRRPDAKGEPPMSTHPSTSAPDHVDASEPAVAAPGDTVGKPSSAPPVADVTPTPPAGSDAVRSSARSSAPPRPVRAAAPVPVRARPPADTRKRSAPAGTTGRRPRSIPPSTTERQTTVDAEMPLWPTTEPIADLPAQVIDTRLGGVFYLLPFALFLELYSDFTRPLEPGLTLSPWDFLALLAPKLLTDPSRDDPLWPLLARLAGRRRRERPGSGFRPPEEWHTPKSWLAAFDHNGTWHWSAAGGTLRLMHPAGFPVAAVPRTDAPARTQLTRELRRLRPLAPTIRRAALPREAAKPVARWATRLAAYADARLRRALDLEPGDSLDDNLFRRRARVFVTPTHVDVVLRLADLPLAVRFAGLDRTPGWIPAAGRHVGLHFE